VALTGLRVGYDARLLTAAQAAARTRSRERSTKATACSSGSDPDSASRLGARTRIRSLLVVSRSCRISASGRRSTRPRVRTTSLMRSSKSPRSRRKGRVTSASSRPLPGPSSHRLPFPFRSASCRQPWTRR